MWAAVIVPTVIGLKSRDGDDGSFGELL
jgi:hypothetical protein